MATNLGLPEGFKIDEPVTTGLPEGFTLDKAQSDIGLSNNPQPDEIELDDAVSKINENLLTERLSDIGLEKARRQIDVGGIETGEPPEIPFREALARDIKSFGGEIQKNVQTSLAKQKRINDLMIKGKKTPNEIEELATYSTGFLTGGLNLKASSAVNRLIGRKLTPEIAERMRLAEQTGTKLSIADITGKKHHALLESFFQQNIPSSDIAQGFALNKVRSVDWFRESIKRQFGGRRGLLEAGQVSQASAWQRLQKFHQIAKQKYKAIPVKPNTSISTDNLSDVASGYLDEIGNLQSGAIKRVLRTTRKGVTPESIKESKILTKSGKPFTEIIPEKPVYNWKQLIDDKSTLLKMMRSTSDFNKRRVFKDLVNAIDDDIVKFSDTVADPSVKVALDDAVNFYKSGGDGLPGIQIFRDRKIANMLASNSPEKIVDNFVKPNNASDVGRLMDTVGKDGRKAVKQAWFEKLTTKGEEQSFSLRKFATGFNKYDDDTLKAFLSKEEIDGLKLLSRASKVSQTAEDLAGNASGTGQSISTFVLARSVLTNPMTAMMFWMGSKRAANIYFNNPTARKLMIEGLKLPAKSTRALDNTFKIMAMEGLLESKIDLSETDQGEQ